MKSFTEPDMEIFSHNELKVKLLPKLIMCSVAMVKS